MEEHRGFNREDKHFFVSSLYEILCAIWNHLYNLKNVKNNTHGRVLLSVKLLALACNFTKSNTPPRVFFTFFKRTNGLLKF